jgi:3-hydroxymyristoyl/3-hydroxydecanoyl-(acyl carrier protein) dehydratase
MPGVHIVENMAQTACFLLARDAAEKDNLYVLAKINKAVFNRKICGGDTLFTEVVVSRMFDELAIISGTVSVDGIVCAKADLVVGVDK